MIQVALKHFQFKGKAYLSIFLVVVFSGMSVSLASAEKMRVVVSSFPLYDFAKNVGGDLVEVKLLLPPGVEAHGFSPTPHDMIAMQQADLFLYTSKNLESWADAFVEASPTGKSNGIEVGEHLISFGDGQHHEHNGEGGHGGDPHIWLNPLFAMKMAEVISVELIKVDPSHRDEYEQNYSKYIGELRQLDKEIEKSLGSCKFHTIISGGHFAFGPFAKRYRLDALSPFQGYSPGAQPSPRAIANLVKYVRKTGSKAIFHEELIQPKIAKIIASETGVTLLLLHGVHNVSKDELQRGESYLSLMRKNLDNLKLGLQCQ